MGNSGQKGARKMIGRSVRRLEDGRFLTGHGRYVADIAACSLPCTATSLRSPHAHALIRADRRFAGRVAGRRAGHLHALPISRPTDSARMPCMAAGEAADRAAAAGAGRGPRAPCRRSGGFHRRRQRGDRARSGRAGSRSTTSRCRPSSMAWRRSPPARRRSGRRRRAISPSMSSKGDAEAGGAGDEAGGARRRGRGDEQPRRRGADRAARRHRPLRRRDAARWTSN